ncbi:MAG: N-acetylmuramoyl-L-alanine amidase [Desulfobacteraceae bacterium]|nr:MAG: N-acetylmuramoyl-L-alanine amidase [Desulfobacteraceae bacterium]
MNADACYKKLRHNSRTIKYHSAWVHCIDQYQKVYKNYPKSSWAPAGMYKAAQLYLKLYKISRNSSDQDHAIDLLNRLILKYPKSAYRYRSARLLKTITPQSGLAAKAPESRASGKKSGNGKKSAKPIEQKKSKKRLTKRYIAPSKDSANGTASALPEDDPGENPELAFEPDPGKENQDNDQDKTIEEIIKTVVPKSYPATGSSSLPRTTPAGDTYVTDLRFWSNPEYTRIVINSTEERPYTHRLLKQDPTINVPFKRLYVDIKNSRLAKNVPEHTPIDDHLLKQARAGQYTSHTVRVVVDIKSFDNYKIFSLKDPFRIVIDVWGKDANGKSAPKPIVAAKKAAPPKRPSAEPTTRLSTDNLKSSDIAKQLALNVRTIVIDPGHGGRDPGAPGYLKGVWEKDLVLKIAKKLAKTLRERLNCTVLLTRSSDKFLTLEERTAIANTKKADLFISLHCNASKNRKLKGIETYFLNLATDDRAIAVAAKENATSKKNISDLETILNDLMKNAKIKESSRLASDVHSSLVTGMKKKYSGINNLGVKQAPFYVLLGARMPSILIETSFLSNKTECKRLISNPYQDALCNSITNGIKKYIDATNPQQI